MLAVVLRDPKILTYFVTCHFVLFVFLCSFLAFLSCARMLPFIAFTKSVFELCVQHSVLSFLALLYPLHLLL